MGGRGAWVVVSCAQCGALLSRPVRPIAGAPSPMSMHDGGDGLPVGVFFRVATADVWNGAFIGSVVVNRDDARNTVGCGVRTGCCGPSGTDGPNLCCPDGHVVGTEVADCWTPHFVFFAADSVVVRDTNDVVLERQVHEFRIAPDATSVWPFYTWLHETLQAADWFGEDVAGFARAWLASNSGSMTVVVHGSGSPNVLANDLAFASIAKSVRDAQPEGRSRRFTIVLA